MTYHILINNNGVNPSVWADTDNFPNRSGNMNIINWHLIEPYKLDLHVNYKYLRLHYVLDIRPNKNTVLFLTKNYISIKDIILQVFVLICLFGILFAFSGIKTAVWSVCACIIVFAIVGVISALLLQKFIVRRCLHRLFIVLCNGLKIK